MLPVRLTADATLAGSAAIRCPHCDSRIELALATVADALGGLGPYVDLGLRLPRVEGLAFNLLHAQRGRWVGRRALLLGVWGVAVSEERPDDRHMLRQLVFRLRHALAGSAWAIETWPNTGYRLVETTAL